LLLAPVPLLLPPPPPMLQLSADREGVIPAVLTVGIALLIDVLTPKLLLLLQVNGSGPSIETR